MLFFLYPVQGWNGLIGAVGPRGEDGELVGYQLDFFGYTLNIPCLAVLAGRLFNKNVFIVP